MTTEEEKMSKLEAENRAIRAEQQLAAEKAAREKAEAAYKKQYYATDKLIAENELLEERAEAAEAKIKELSEQKPVGYGAPPDCNRDGRTPVIWVSYSPKEGDKLYLLPIPSPEVAELLGKIEYLESYIEAQKESFDEIAQGNIELQKRIAELEKK